MMLSNEFPINYFSVSEVEQDWPEEFQVWLCIALVEPAEMSGWLTCANS